MQYKIVNTAHYTQSLIKMYFKCQSFSLKNKPLYDYELVFCNIYFKTY